MGGAPNNIAEGVPLADREVDVHRQQLGLMWLPNVLQEPLAAGQTLLEVLVTSTSLSCCMGSTPMACGAVCLWAEKDCVCVSNMG